MIRPATLSDIPEIARLGERFHEQAGWSDVFEYSADDCAASLARFFKLDCFICFVAENDGQIAGMVSGVLSPVYFNAGHLSGEELFWWVDPTSTRQGIGMGLLKALEAEAKARGAQSFQMKSLARLNGERMGRVYERQGYRASEYTFIKRL